MFPCISPQWVTECVCTLVQTTTTGIPRLCVSVLSPNGSSTLSSSSLLLCGVPSSPLPGSVYSWNCFTTAHTQTTLTYTNNNKQIVRPGRGYNKHSHNFFAFHKSFDKEAPYQRTVFIPLRAFPWRNTYIYFVFNFIYQSAWLLSVWLTSVLQLPQRFRGDPEFVDVFPSDGGPLLERVQGVPRPRHVKRYQQQRVADRVHRHSYSLQTFVVKVSV